MNHLLVSHFLFLTSLFTTSSFALEPIRVGDDGSHFVEATSGERFIVWGVNYDHDGSGRLLDEYWQDEWETVVEDFAEIKALGANCVRIHLQLGLFMKGPNEPNQSALRQLAKLVTLAEESELYLDVTGLACYHKKNIPAWYDALGEQERWNVQANFWEAVAHTCQSSPAIFCYDLMNEPIAPGKEPAKEWLGGELGGKFFVQRIALDAGERTREEVAKAWVKQMTDAIRKHDQRHMITVGVIPWVFVFGGGKPFFHSPEVGEPLDFVAVHFYPEQGKLDKALTALKKYDIGKPLLIEEMFPLKSGIEEMEEFVRRSSDVTDGWISFYWGQTPQELESLASPDLGQAITAKWLRSFEGLAPQAKAGTLREVETETFEVSVLSDIPYKSDPKTDYEQTRCKLDLYLPKGQKNFPTIVWFHGGGLQNGGKDGKHDVPVATRFAADGIAVASVNYRLSPQAKFPAYIDDAAAAVAYIRKKIAQHGGDEQLVFVSGHSAGGYLTSMVGMDASYLKAYGTAPQDLAGYIPIAGQMITHSTVRGERGIPRTQPIIDAAAPAYHVTKDRPPFLCIVGSEDLPARAEENRYFVAAMQAAGHKNITYLEVEGRNHATIAQEMHLQDDDVAEQVKAFIKRVKLEITD